MSFSSNFFDPFISSSIFWSRADIFRAAVALKSPTVGLPDQARDISSLKWYKECLTGAPQQSPWQQWLLIPKQVKQQWITSNQAQSTEGVIMHTAAAASLLSLCKPSLPLSLSLKVLWAEWLICDYWFLEIVGGIEGERKEGRREHPVFWVAPRCSSRLWSFI